jgi:hypothetical protein
MLNPSWDASQWCYSLNQSARKKRDEISPKWPKINKFKIGGNLVFSEFFFSRLIFKKNPKNIFKIARFISKLIASSQKYRRMLGLFLLSYFLIARSG